MKNKVLLFGLLLLAAPAVWADVKDNLQKGDRAFKAKDYATALQQYQEAAKQGSAAAENNLGYLYAHGLGVTQDYAQALGHYRTAAEAGNAAAENNLGRLYSEGSGVGKNDREAFRWHAKAAGQGDPEGEYWVGYFYALGKGVKRNPSKAATWLQASAKAGYAPAQAGLGTLYKEGIGVKKDEAKSKELYQAAAHQNNPEAVEALDGKIEYTVAAGDNLWSIARRFLTKGHLWNVIYESNKDLIRNPSLIHPGQVLNIQKIEL